jgi:hypothetical protein
LLPELKILGPKASTWPEAEISFAEGGKSRDYHDSIGWEVMRLKAESIHKSPSESTSREAKSPFEMGNEDYKLNRSDIRGELVAREPTLHIERDPPREAEPFDVHCRDIRPLLGPTGLVYHHLLLSSGRSGGRARGHNRWRWERLRLRATCGGRKEICGREKLYRSSARRKKVRRWGEPSGDERMERRGGALWRRGGGGTAAAELRRRD